MINIGLHLCKIIIRKLVHNFLLVCILGFLQDGLKNFTLNIVFQFLSRVTSENILIFVCEVFKIWGYTFALICHTDDCCLSGEQRQCQTTFQEKNRNHDNLLFFLLEPSFLQVHLEPKRIRITWILRLHNICIYIYILFQFISSWPESPNIN